MARLINFRSLVAESLETGDAIDFQKLMKKRLTESYLRQQQILLADTLQEQNGPTAATKITSATKSYGAKNAVVKNGVIMLVAPSKDSAYQIASYLDDESSVNSYEVSPDYAKDSGSPADLEDQTSAHDIEYTFTIYINAEEAQYKTFVRDEEMDDEEMDDEPDNKKMNESFESRPWLFEVEKKVEYVDGVKRTSIDCPVGSKWDEEKQRCSKPTVEENRQQHYTLIENQNKETEAKEEAVELSSSSKRINR